MMKKQCEKLEKNLGNRDSVLVHLRIYGHVLRLSISKHLHLIFVYQFCHAFKFKLLSIVLKCTASDTSPKYSPLALYFKFGAKTGSEKKISES